MAMKAYYQTFGCKLNFAETSTLAQMLQQHGIDRAGASDVPDIVVVNTCSVTDVADHKCRQSIRRLARRWPQAAIIVTGCYAQLKPAEVAQLPGVAVVAGSNQKLDILRFLEHYQATGQQQVQVPHSREARAFMPSCSRGDRTRYFLKVQDGCDYWCTYCTIPAARGRSRSGTVAQIVQQATQAAAQGAQEIVITGVNIGDFGKGTSENFYDLVRALDVIEGIKRYRISSIEPNLLTDEIIDFCATSQRFMPHFHIPLQCGSDRVLALMRRHYDTALFASKIRRVRQAMPDAFIGVDLIVGARGETADEFQRSYDFVSDLDISRLHVFPYSERPGTKALEIDHIVSADEKRQRMDAMLALSEAKLSAFHARFIGQRRPVLFEHGTRGAQTFATGFTDNYIKVEAVPPTPAIDLDNVILPVTITATGSHPEAMAAKILI